MKLTYDPNHNVAYLRLHEKKAHVDTIRISDEMNVDLAPDGTIYGIELLNAQAQLEVEDNGTLVVINELKGTQQEMPLMARERTAKYSVSRKRRTAPLRPL